MGLIDSNLVLWEGDLLTASNGSAIALNSLFNPGQAEPIPLRVQFTEDLAGATAVTFKLQHSDKLNGTYTDTGSAVSVPAADFKVGGRLMWRFLPATVSKQYIRLDVAVTGTATAGKIFAAIMREDPQSYTAGMYIDAGVVRG